MNDTLDYNPSGFDFNDNSRANISIENIMETELRTDDIEGLVNRLRSATGPGMSELYLRPLALLLANPNIPIAQKRIHGAVGVRQPAVAEAMGTYIIRNLISQGLIVKKNVRSREKGRPASYYIVRDPDAVMRYLASYRNT